MAGASSGGASSGAIKAGRAFVEISANVAPLLKGIDQIGKKFQSVGKQFALFGAGISAAGAAAFLPLAGLVNYASDAGSAVTDMAERLNTSTETLSTLGYAASLAGGSLEDVEGSISKMRKTLVDGAEAGDRFAQALVGQDLDTQLAAIADKIAATSGETQQLGVAMDYFGSKSGRKMLPYLKDGSAGLAKMRVEAERLGAVIGGPEAKNADEYGDAITKIVTVFKSAGRAIGAGIIASTGMELQTLTERIIDIGVTVRKFIAENQAMIATIFKVSAAVIAVGAGIMALGGVLAAIGVVVSGFAAALGIVAVILSPAGLIVAGLAALSAALGIALYEATNFGSVFGDTWTGIQDAMTGGDLELAMSIAMEGVQIVFQEAVNGLERVWINFKYFFIGVFDELKKAADKFYDQIPNAPWWMGGPTTTTKTTRGVRRAPGAAAPEGSIPAIDNSLEARRKRELDAVSAADSSKLDEMRDAARLKANNAAFAKEMAEWEAYENSLGQTLNVAAETFAGAIKGAFASSFDARTYAFGDKNDVAKNTKKTADGVQELVALVERGDGAVRMVP
jgi:hypothetical protein